jgi:hypothetical protein
MGEGGVLNRDPKRHAGGMNDTLAHDPRMGEILEFGAEPGRFWSGVAPRDPNPESAGDQVGIVVT